MAFPDLPSRDSPDLRLVVAEPEECLAQAHLNSEEWHGALSLDGYLRREQLLSDQELTKDGGSTAWVLVYQPDSQGPRQVVCGCESQNRRAVVARDGRVNDVAGHVIGSVFCPPEFRGRGYASRMMTEVADKLRSWQADRGVESLFSVLYSDIGKKFYAARGWQPFPSAHISLPATPVPTSVSPPVRLLKDDDLAELCALDEQLLRRRLSLRRGKDRSTVALVPDYRTIRWHQVREDFVAGELKGAIPEVKGALVGEQAGSRVWAYWARVWRDPRGKAPNVLYILRLVVEGDADPDRSALSPSDIAEARGSDVAIATAAVLSAAQAQAAQWDMEEVQIWNPTSATVAAAQALSASAEVVHREEESITSLLWYGQGSWKDVDWVCNEKYGWS